ncbi:MAG TPA: PAS domain S-box protein [Syntrophales bacterium]|nr:PAS domain S-box protein [Syntrophales bacterium]
MSEQQGDHRRGLPSPGPCSEPQLFEPGADGIRAGLILVDKQNRTIVQANQAAVDLFGIDGKRDGLERVCREFIYPRAQTVPPGSRTDADAEEPLEKVAAPPGGRKVLKSVMPISLDGRRFLIVSLVDVTDRMEIEQALHESEQKFRSLFEYSPDAVFAFDADGRFLNTNVRTSSLTGYSSAELRLMTFDRLIDDRDLERVREHFRKAMKGETQNYEIAGRRKDGTVFHAQITNIPLVANGRVFGVYGIARDVTEAKRALAELRENEARLRLITDTMGDIVWTQDLNLRTTYVSPSIEKVLGYTSEERIRQTLEDQLTADSLERVKTLLSEELRREEEGADPDRSLTVEIEYRRKDGGTLWMENKIKGIRDAKGKLTGVVGLSRDISQRKKAVEALQASEDKYRQLFDMESDAIFLIDNETLDILEANESACALFGYSRGDLLCMKQTDLSNEPALTRQAVLEHRSKVALRYYRKKDGTVFPCEIASRYFIRNDRIVHIAAVRDITDRKQKEDEILQSLARFRTAMGAVIQTVTSMTEARDPYTSGHQRRVASLARHIAREMGLPQESIDAVRTAGAIHDIGKISVPAEILSKPSRLSDPELGLIRNHPETAYGILKGIEFPWPVAEIIRQHHERMNGSGYPRGLKGEAILMEARVLAVSDVVEAIASHRPYRPSLGIETALREIEERKGTLYDEKVVEACLRLFREKQYRFEANGYHPEP